MISLLKASHAGKGKDTTLMLAKEKTLI